MWWEALLLPTIPRVMLAELKLLVGPPKLVRSRMRKMLRITLGEGNSDTNSLMPEAATSVVT
jgi:hypothetical protein